MKRAGRIIPIILALLLLCSCGILRDAAEAESYEFGDDIIPSIKAVLGEARKVTGVHIGFKNDTQRKEYSYKSDTVYDDVVTYIKHMHYEEGWTVIEDEPGYEQLAKESVDEGCILLIDINFYRETYTVLLQKAEGTITYFE